MQEDPDRRDYTFETPNARERREGRQLIGLGFLVAVGGTLFSLMIAVPSGAVLCLVFGAAMVAWGRIKIWSAQD